MSTIWTRETLTSVAADELQNEIKGKNVLITGVTVGGLGFEAAYAVAKYAKHLIIVGSRPAGLQESETKIREEYKEVQITKVIADLTSLESVRSAVKVIKALNVPLHVIIANAIGKVRNQYTLSADGHENQFAISHLAHFVLVNSLLPLVYAARSDDPSFPPRIIIVSSIAQAFGPVHLEDPNFDNGKEYDVVKGYAQAKTANVLFSKELAKRLAGKGVLSFSFHPGSISTPGAQTIPDEEKMIFGKFLKEASSNGVAARLGILDAGAAPQIDFIRRKDLNQGALTYIVAAFDPRIKDRSGAYLSEDGQIHEELVAPYASDPENAKKLWTLSEKLVGETFDI